MAIILNIETATKNCSVSISENGKTIALKELNEGGYTHAENLHLFIEDVLTTAKLKINNLDAVAVSMGPGSYTGLRIGVSAAKGICFAADIPLISINTLLILACQLTVENGFIVPLLDARRMEVYSAVLDSNHQLQRKIEAEIITNNSFDTFLNEENVYFLGDGAEKCKSIIIHPNARFLDNRYPSANEMGKLAEDKFNNHDFEDVAYFEPFYLKDFISTAHLK